MKYIYVTYDPLLEKVLCVHKTFASECKLCKKISEKRIEDGRYHLIRQRFKIKD